MTCIKQLEARAFFIALKSYRLEIIFSLCLISVTWALNTIFPAIGSNKRVLFLVSSLWPGGIAIVLVLLWINIIRSIRKNLGYGIYDILEQEINTHIPEKDMRNSFLIYFLDKRGRLTSSNISVRRKALGEVIGELKQRKVIKNC